MRHQAAGKCRWVPVGGPQPCATFLTLNVFVCVRFSLPTLYSSPGSSPGIAVPRPCGPFTYSTTCSRHLTSLSISHAPPTSVAWLSLSSYRACTHLRVISSHRMSVWQLLTPCSEVPSWPRGAHTSPMPTQVLHESFLGSSRSVQQGPTLAATLLPFWQHGSWSA